MSIGASASAATNTMSSANSGNAEQITITGLSVATSAATYSVTIDGTEITTSALTATSAGDLVSVFNTALSAASVDITVTSTSGSELIFTFDDAGLRADLDSSIDFSSSKTAGFSAGSAATTIQGTGSGFNFSLEIDKDSSGNIPVGQQSLVLEYVEVTSGVSEVISLTGFSGSTTGGTYSITIDGTTVTTAAQGASASAGAVATALDSALSAAGISVDVTSSNASGMTFTFAEGAVVDQHNSLNLSAQNAAGFAAGSTSTTTQGVTSANNVVVTENLSITSKPFNQHTFTVNLTVNEGEGQGVSDEGLNVTTRTTNDNAR